MAVSYGPRLVALALFALMLAPGAGCGLLPPPPAQPPVLELAVVGNDDQIAVGQPDVAGAINRQPVGLGVAEVELLRASAAAAVLGDELVRRAGGGRAC